MRLNVFGLREMADIEAEAEQIVMWEYPDPARDGLQEVDGRLAPIDDSLDESADTYSDSVTALSLDPYLGKVYGSPQVVKLPYPEMPGYKWAVVFGNGYDSYNQTPVLYILDALDGRVLKRIFTTKPEESAQPDMAGNCNAELGCNGLSTPVLVDVDEDGIIDCAYGGDLLGNLWKFDFTGGEIFGFDGWMAAFYDQSDADLNGTPAPRPLISVRDKLGNPQPIMTRPTVTRPCTTAGTGLMVLFGTGWTDAEQANEDNTQSIYGIWDWQDLWKNNFDFGIDPAASYYGEIAATESGSASAAVCSSAARSDCERSCEIGCAAGSADCESICAESAAGEPERQDCMSACAADSDLCVSGCTEQCFMAAQSGFDTITCQSETTAVYEQCLAAAEDLEQQSRCETDYAAGSGLCASYWDSYLGCSTTRTLSNLAQIMSSEQAASISLLEQTQLSLVGLDYYSEEEAMAAGGQVRPGDIKASEEDPLQIDGYDGVVRTISDQPINWFNPEERSDVLQESTHVGWFFDLPLEGEQLATDPAVYDGMLYYATQLPSTESCSAGEAVVMAQQSCSGGRAEAIVFDINRDNALSSRDSVALYDLGGLTSVSGIVQRNMQASPTIIAALGRDLVYLPGHVAPAAAQSSDILISSIWFAPGVEKMVTRGKNLGLYFWRELF